MAADPGKKKVESDPRSERRRPIQGREKSSLTLDRGGSRLESRLLRVGVPTTGRWRRGRCGLRVGSRRAGHARIAVDDPETDWCPITPVRADFLPVDAAINGRTT